MEPSEMAPPLRIHHRGPVLAREIWGNGGMMAGSRGLKWGKRRKKALMIKALQVCKIIPKAIT